MTVAGAKHIRDFAAWQVSTVKHGFKDTCCFCRKRIYPYFFLDPEQDARAQPVWFDKPLHEGDLIKTGFKEELRKGSQGFLA